jgi:hypothetical protein
MRSRQKVFSFYYKSILLSALAFGFTDGFQATALGFVRNGNLYFHASYFITMISYEFIQCVLFIFIGLPSAYVPVLLLEYIIVQFPKHRWRFLAILFGFLLGIIFDPICAVVAYFPFYEDGDPSYLERCLEFALPMLIAGTIGGYSFYAAKVRGEKEIE